MQSELLPRDSRSSFFFCSQPSSLPIYDYFPISRSGLLLKPVLTSEQKKSAPASRTRTTRRTICSSMNQEEICAVCDAVIDIAAALFNVSGRELRHPGRTSLQISRVRQIAMYATHVSLAISMRDVGIGFGRDRTTVLHACHTIEDLRDDGEFDAIVTMVERVIRAAFGTGER